MDALKPMMDFIKTPNDCDTWEDIVRECNDTVDEAIVREVEHQDSEEYIIDAIQSNEYEFNEDGSIA